MTTSVLWMAVIPVFVTAERHRSEAEEPAQPVDLAALEPRQDPVPADEGPQLPHWSGTFNLGLNWASGNNDQLTTNFAFDAMREAEGNRWTLKSFGSYLEESGVTSQQTLGGSAKYDHFLTDRTFLFGAGGADHDLAADIRVRYAASAGVGRKLVDEEKLKWDGNAGIGYLVRTYRGMTPDNESATADLGYNLVWQMAETSRFSQDLVYLPSLEDIEAYFGRVDSRIDVTLTEKLIGRLQYVFQYDSQAAIGAQKADHQLILSIGWSFGQ